jgi:hypothetical protein
MPMRVRDLQRMYVGKLEAVEEEGSGHTKYRIYHGDRLLAHTVLSRSHGELDDSMVAKIARQLSVTRVQLNRLVECPMSFEEYAQHVLAQK